MATETSKNLWQKILAIMMATGAAPKTGYNAFHKYHYTTEKDVIEMIRPELMTQGLIVLPSVTERHQDGDITNLLVSFKIVDTATGDSVDVVIPGAGQDKGDKGPYKAMTGAEKYFLMKTFMIPTEDDPENETAPQQVVSRPAPTPQRAAPQAPQTVTAAAGTDACSKCGGHSLTVKTSRSPKNPGRQYLHCETCNGFSRWADDAAPVRTVTAPATDDGSFDSLMENIDATLGLDGEPLTLEM